MGVICFTDPRDIECLISGMSNLEKNRIYEPLLPWLNTGLLTSGGKGRSFRIENCDEHLNNKDVHLAQKWRLRRKILTPSFHFNILRQFVSVFGRQTEVTLAEMEASYGRESFDVTVPLTSFTLRTICGKTRFLTASKMFSYCRVIEYLTLSRWTN